jgi:Uma2 family endonuclease
VNSIDELDFSKTYTYADYYSWRFEERVELIRGKVFKMVNYPGATCMGTRHQTILGNIVYRCYDFLKRTDVADVFMAPFDVRLIDKSSYDHDISNVVQPDISIFLDKNKIDERGAIGTPNIVIEILKTGDNRTELKEKFQLYEDFGVSEYWLIFSGELAILKYVLNNQGKFVPNRRPLTLGDKITTSVLPGFEMLVDDIFLGLL